MKTVIEMAREAGAYIADLPLEDAVLFEVDILSGRSEKLERFAELVRADERERFMQAVEELRPVQSIPLLQNKPPEFWIDGFKRAIEARGNISVIKQALAQAERPWVGLTFEEKQHALYLSDWKTTYMEAVIEYIEQTLKEKNTCTPPEERNFCPRCGKRTADLTTIHTCTPPQERNT